MRRGFFSFAVWVSLCSGQPLDRGQVALGRKLFFDTRLSRTGTVACGWCHDLGLAFTDGKTVSDGIYGRPAKRNAPALINRAGSTAQFWDGRAASLEEQVLMPIEDRNEMGMTVPEVTAIFGISRSTLAEALASYVRSIRSGNSRVDQGRLTPEEQLGQRIFSGKGNCAVCHSGSNYTDERFHNTGIGWRDGRFADEGRFAVTGHAQDHGAFKTPTLREVGRTAPYMHDGSIATLEEAVEHFDRGGVRNPQLDGQMQPLGLSAEEKRALVAFLKALDGEVSEGPE